MIELCKKNDLLDIYEMIKKTCYMSWKNFYPEKSIFYGKKYFMTMVLILLMKKNLSAGQ